jgi:hypothetical protein
MGRNRQEVLWGKSSHENTSIQLSNSPQHSKQFRMFLGSARIESGFPKTPETVSNALGKSREDGTKFKAELDVSGTSFGRQLDTLRVAI